MVGSRPARSRAVAGAAASVPQREDESPRVKYYPLPIDDFRLSSVRKPGGIHGDQARGTPYILGLHPGFGLLYEAIADLWHADGLSCENEYRAKATCSVLRTARRMSSSVTYK